MLPNCTGVFKIVRIVNALDLVKHSEDGKVFMPKFFVEAHCQNHFIMTLISAYPPLFIKVCHSDIEFYDCQHVKKFRDFVS